MIMIHRNPADHLHPPPVQHHGLLGPSEPPDLQQDGPHGHGLPGAGGDGEAPGGVPLLPDPDGVPADPPAEQTETRDHQAR